MDSEGDDFAGDTSTSGVLEINGTATGELEANGDDDWFTITVEAGDQIRFDFTGITLSDPFLRLYDADGNQIASNDDGGPGLNSQIVFNFDTAGTYYVSARGFADSRTGTYELSATLIEDDFAGDTTTTGVLAIDGTVTGTIDFASDEDWFAIELTAGDIVRIASDGSSADIALRNSTGDFVASDQYDFTTDQDVIFFEVGESGTYYIDVDGDFNSPVDYTLSATLIEDDFTNDATTSGSLPTNGNVLTGTIDYANDEDWIKFIVTEAGTYLIDMDGITLSSADLRLLDSDGNFLAFGNFTSDGQSLAYDFEAGTYFISASGDFSSDTGTYELSATLIEDDYTNDATTTGSLPTNGNVLTGTIDYANDEDWIKFIVTEAGIYQIDMDVITLSSADLRLLDSDGNFLAFGNFTSDGETLTYDFEAGTYFISASGGFSSDTGTGTYELSATLLEDDFAGDTSTSGVLEIDGGAVTGTIDFASDEDWFAIELTAGDIVRIASDGSSADIALRNSAGSFVAGDQYDFTVDQDVILFEVGESGTYYIDVDGDFNSPVDYTLSATLIEDDFAGDTSTAGILEIDGTVTGTIDFASDEDWFAIELTAGEIVRIASDGFAADIALRDANGNFVASDLFDPDANQDVIFAQVQVSGTYYIDVDGDFSTPVDYTLSATVIEDDFAAGTSTTGVLEVDGTTTGIIDFANDRDWFAIELTAGNLVRIASDGIFETGLTLRDEFGDIVTFTFDEFDINTNERVLIADGIDSGTYYLEVSGGSTSPFNYTLTASTIENEIADNTSTTGVLVLDDAAVTGSIDFASDVDWFAIELTAGELVRITSEGTLADITLLDSNGNFIAGDQIDFGTNQDVIFTEVQESGTYYVAVDGDFRGSLDFSLAASVVTDDFTGDASTTGVLDLDGTATTGSIDYANDVDWFAIELTAGDTVGITSDGLFANMTLLDQFGAVIQFDQIDFSANQHVIITQVQETGTYYVAVDGQGSTTDYTLTANVIDDDFASDTSTTGVLELGGTATGTIDFSGDEDWFAIELTAGNLIRIASEGASADIVLLDANGNFVRFDQFDSSTNQNLITLQVQETGTYYVAAGGNSATPDYTLSASVIEDDYSADTNTSGVLLPDGTIATGDLEVAGDRDWFSLTITEGGFFQVDLEGVSLEDAFLGLYDGEGNLLATNDDGGRGLDSRLIYDFDPGQYYVSAQSYADGSSGTYELTIGEVVPPSPTDALDWGSYIEEDGEGTTQIEVFFMPGGNTFDAGFAFVESVDFTQYEIDQFNVAFDQIEAFIDVEFVVVTDPNDADFSLGMWSDPSTGLLGFMFPQGEGGENEGTGFFNRGGIGGDGEGGSGLNLGSFGYSVLVHELGHGLGLSHPHDTGGGSDVLPGIFNPQTDPGTFNLNQSIFTIMSYNEGWSTNPNGGATTSDDFGHQSGFAPLDIAVLQQAYGANTSTGLGDTVYELADTNIAGTSFQAIFDNGGTDLIRSTSNTTTLINLNDASLAYEEGGGGFVSNVAGIHGGFTIANGTVIENAMTGAGDDVLIGNEADNILTSGIGADILSGGLGNDTLLGEDGIDNLFGGDGDDILIGGSNGDILNGGDGFDTASYEGSTNRVVINMATNSVTSGHATGDTFESIENIAGSRFNDTITGDGGSNVIIGGAGFDVLSGFHGDDHLIGGEGRDFMFGGAGADIIDGGAGSGDFARYVGSDAGVTIDLEAGTASGGHAAGDTLISIEFLFGSSHGDSLTGDSNNNFLLGDGGDDVLSGGAGIDKLFGGSGADSFLFGAGDEFVYVADFEDDVDKIDLSDFGFSTIEEALENFDQRGDHARFFMNGETLLILNTQLEDLADDIDIGSTGDAKPSPASLDNPLVADFADSDIHEALLSTAPEYDLFSTEESSWDALDTTEQLFDLM